MELCLACVTRIYNLFVPRPLIVPESTKICIMCFESGALKRKCCNAVFCDHCYTKNKFCPNCNSSTRREEKSGATFTLNTFSEHEECRVCLEPGLQRQCCGNYYCDDCYYLLPNCRSCHNRVVSKGLGFSLRAESMPVLLGWITSIGVGIIVISFFMVLAASEARQPQGISEYFCDGFFRQCSISVCVDMKQAVAEGNAPLPAIHTWQQCTLDSTVKMITKGCIFDPTLYTATVTNMGYDVCESSFVPGVYIFEDTFDHWVNKSFSSNAMKSAKWGTIINGYPSPSCGVAEHLGGESALVFGGQMQRFAETKDLDLSSGGFLEAQVLLAPEGWDVTNPLCKSNYEGTIHIEYSIDKGKSWKLLYAYEPLLWRSSKFFPIKYELPHDGATNHTRFRFNQPLFQAARDQWALDNVRVFRYLPRDWESTPSRRHQIELGKSGMQKAQCCFDTDWCESRLSEKDFEECTQYPWYKEKTYLLRNAELVMCLAMAIGILKFLYVAVQDYLIWERYPFQSDIKPMVDIIRKRLYALLPPRFRPRRDISKYIDDVHVLARMDGMHAHLHEDEGEGERIKQDEEKQAEREQRRRARAKKLAKKLERREMFAAMKNKHAAAKVAELDNEPVSSDSEESVPEEVNLEKFAEDKIADDVEKLKRQNLSALKSAFEIRRSPVWINSFAAITIGSAVLLFLFQISSTKYYFIYEVVRPFGAAPRSVFFNSYLFNVVALLVDAKEIWYCIRYVVPLFHKWDPMVTLDRSAETMSLFIDHHRIPLENIESIQLFSAGFCMLCGLGYLLGAMPWALLSMVLRSEYLEYSTMRVITPIIGGVLVARALLGPAVFVKIMFCGYYLLSYNMFTRERLGLACMAPRTINSAINFALAFVVIAGLLTGIVAYGWMLRMMALALVFGFLYGALAGWEHGMPIKPWIHLTSLDAGMYYVLRKKHQCPFIYWGNYCTEMHQFTEVLIVFTTDDVQFVNTLKGGGDVVM